MYTYTWKKYLPLIRLLLKKAVQAEQSVMLNRTDFEKTTKLKKPTCVFTVEITRGRPAVTSHSAVAKDLIEILLPDEESAKWLSRHHYSISLDSGLILHIKQIPPPETSAD